MRVTNSMMTNSMLLNLTKNANITNNYYTQLATSKRFQQPSEDPISASRALRFRTNVSNTEQYQKNVSSANAWMDVTDTAFSNVTEILTDRVTYLINQGANDTLSLSDRQMIVEEIEDLVSQIADNEMNANYAGRYVFSGYKTDEPPILTSDDTDTYTIEQTFTIDDIWSRTVFQKPTMDISSGESGQSTITEVSELNLAYDNLDGAPTLTFTDKTTGVETTLTANSFSSSDPNAYSPAAGEVNYIEETGELIFGEDVLNQFMKSDLTVSYTKTGFVEGELNPKVYFDCVNETTGVSYELTDDPMMYNVGIGTDIQVNSNARDVYTDNMYSVLKTFTESINSMSVSTEDSLRAYYTAQGYTGDALEEKIEEQQTIELNNVKTASHDIFNSMISKLESFASTVSAEHTSLGTKMNRLDIIESRLGDDETNYTELLSENEDADYMEVVMKLNSAETTYQAAMQVGAKLMQMSLVNYL